MSERKPFGAFARAGTVTAVFAVLLVISRRNYLLFHSFAELFSIAIAYAAFMFAWNTRKYTPNRLLAFLGLAYLFVGSIDVLHALTYKGMGVFPGLGSNPPTQLWIAARYIEAASLLIGFSLVKKKLPGRTVIAVYTAVVALLLLSIFRWGNFPDCFVEGKGLTGFKIASEFVITGILAAALALLYVRKDEFEPGVLRLLAASIILTVCAEMSFTLYKDVYGFFNMLGHYFKLISFYLIYLAVLDTGITSPFNLLFRDLKASEERYHSLFRNMIDGVAIHRIILDEQGRPVDYIFLEFNDAFESLTGLRGRDIIGRRVTEVLPGIEKDPADWIGRYGRVALGGGPSRFEQYSEALNRWYSVSAFSTEREYFVAVFEDITERKRMVEDLQHTNAINSAILDNMPDSICIIDISDFSIKAANKEFLKEYGQSGKEVIGKKCHEVTHGLDSPCPGPENVCPLDSNVMAGETSMQVHGHKREDGSQAYFEIWAIPVKDSSGKTVQSVHITRDITERKEMEASLRRAVRDRETLIKETNHRVKNNLIVIQSLLSLQSREIKDKEARDKFEESQNRVKAMSMLHERLYRSESLRRVDTREYMEALIKSIRYGYVKDDSGIVIISDIKDISLDISTMIPCALIVNELISNAFKHAFPDGRGNLEVSLSGSPESGYILSVKDNGRGLPEGFNIESSDSLGLEIVKSLTNQLEGRLEIIDEGGGTEFRIIFSEAAIN